MVNITLTRRMPSASEMPQLSAALSYRGVPEPATWALLMLGLCWLGLLSLRNLPHARKAVLVRQRRSGTSDWRR